MRHPNQFRWPTSTRTPISDIAPAVAMAILFWLILTQTFGAYIASAAPQAASRLPLHSAAADLARADAILKFDEKNHEPLSPERKIRLRNLAINALRSEPLDTHGLEILGLIAIAEHRFELADYLMSEVAARSRRRPFALYWLLQRKRETRQYGEAVSYADSLLRIRPQSISLVIPELATMSETIGAQTAIERLLSQNPPWRAAFFAHLKGHIRNPRTPLQLLLNLKNTAYPPTTAEIRPYLDLLIKNRLYQLAYYSWLQFLTPAELGEAGLIYNGNFKLPSSHPPFDWEIRSSANAEIEIVPRDDEPTKNALAIRLGRGRIDFPPVSQMLMLAPGGYTLSGLFKGKIDGARGLRWKIQCIGQTIRNNQTKMFIGTASQWTAFTTDISIPAGCEAQVLKLFLDSRFASETMISGSAWFANLAISRH